MASTTDKIIAALRELLDSPRWDTPEHAATIKDYLTRVVALLESPLGSWPPTKPPAVPVPDELGRNLDGLLRTRLGAVAHRSGRSVGYRDSADGVARFEASASDDEWRAALDAVVAKLEGELKPGTLYNACHQWRAHEFMVFTKPRHLVLTCAISLLHAQSEDGESSSSSSSCDE